MSIWQFNAAVKGYAKANSPEQKGKFSSAEEMDEAFAFALSDHTSLILTTGKIYVWDDYGINLILDKTVTFFAEEIKKPRIMDPEKREQIRQKRLEQKSGSIQ